MFFGLALVPLRALREFRDACVAFFLLIGRRVPRG
jgi:hypothetical protein